MGGRERTAGRLGGRTDRSWTEGRCTAGSPLPVATARLCAQAADSPPASAFRRGVGRLRGQIHPIPPHSGLQGSPCAPVPQYFQRHLSRLQVKKPFPLCSEKAPISTVVKLISLPNSCFHLKYQRRMRKRKGSLWGGDVCGGFGGRGRAGGAGFDFPPCRANDAQGSEPRKSA